MNDRLRRALQRIANSPSIRSTPAADALRSIAREAIDASVEDGISLGKPATICLKTGEIIEDAAHAPVDDSPLPCIKCDRPAITDGYCEECAPESAPVGPAPVGDEREALERLNRFADAIAKACERWGWTHATTEVELIESIDDLLEFKRLLTEGKYLLYTHDGEDFALIEWKEFEAGEGLCLCEDRISCAEVARRATKAALGLKEEKR